MEINLRKTMANINKCFNKRNDTIKFIDDYRSMILEAKRRGILYSIIFRKKKTYTIAIKI